MSSSAAGSSAPVRSVRARDLADTAASMMEDDAADESSDDETMGQQGGKKLRSSSGVAVERPNFPALTAQQASGGKSEFRRVPVPPHRYTPLRKDWMQLYTPIVEHLKLDVRMNPRNRSVEIKTSQHTEDVEMLQKAADFIRAYIQGFEVVDAVALLRVEDLFVDSFMVTDVKILKGDHLSRAIGRIAGKDGKCKYAIENATKTRIILAENRVHILGSFANIKMARDAVCALILGSPISKVYTNLRSVSARIGHKI
jgi:RNA-binding protein PNO1